MEDKVYCGRLVSDDKLEHSSGPWKKHAYVKKTQEDGYVRYWYDVNNGKDPYNRTPEQRAKDKEAADKLREASYVDESYWYPDGPDGKEKGYMQNGATDKEIEAAENEYKAAEAAYRKNPSPNNRTRLNKAEEEVSRARAIKRRDGKYEEKSTKGELKKEAIRKGKELFSRSKESYRTVETRSMPNGNSEAEDRKKKRKSLSLFNHGVRHTGSKKKESKSDEVLKLEPTGNISNSAPTRQNRVGEKYQYYNGAFLSSGAKRESYTSIGNKKPISRPKNLIGSRASKDAMDDFLQDHPNVHKTQGTNKVNANLSTSIDASPVKDKKLRKQKAGRR